MESCSFLRQKLILISDRVPPLKHEIAFLTTLAFIESNNNPFLSVHSDNPPTEPAVYPPEVLQCMEEVSLPFSSTFTL